MLVAVARPLAFMLLGLAASAIGGGSVESSAESGAVNPLLPLGRRSMPPIWRYLLPYCSVPVVVALMIYAARTPGNSHRALPVYVAGALLIELVLLHQFLDYRELIAFASRNARLESLAANDPVTGVPNHRTVVSALDGEVTRARRYGRACAVLFLDLDHFKALNDGYGHPSGDAALREFASVVRSALREPDSLGRWGGEEFVAVLPETDGEAAVIVAERVRAAVATHTFWAAGGAHLTCSVGVAAYPQNADSRDALIERADQAMYAAKRLGRNQVRSAGDPAVAALEAGSGQHGSRDESALSGTIEALAALAEARDRQGAEHPHGVSALSARLALELGLDTSEAHLVGMAGRLQDIGKVAIPDGILSKPGPLTDQEWEQIRRHPEVGAAVISRIPRLGMLASVIRAHHEHWDGQGYPDRLQGKGIPFDARILAVADAFAAMTADRPYRPAMSPDSALAEIDRCAGSQFDPEVVEALRRVLRVSLGQGVA
jgi:diguanylate cyclase (GGDEF)-like protein